MVNSQGKKILVCCGTGCIANNSLNIYYKLKKEIEDLNLNISVEPEIKATGCSGLCEKGPVIRIVPDDVAYFKVSIDDITEIINKTILKGEIIERLLYYDSTNKTRVQSHKNVNFYKKQKKLVLKNIGEIDPTNINDYIQADGYKALAKAMEMTSDEIITEVEKSGLRGRGGAGFHTGKKWRTCYSYNNFPKYIVCNGDEGDPGAFMDCSIMEGNPHSIIEGMAICAKALNVKHGFIYIRDEYTFAVKKIKKAIIDAKNSNYLGGNILNTNFSFDLDIVRGGGAFVCGESSALMASIEGRVGEPRAKYIRSVERGLWDHPTVLNNVETWANIPIIINNGAEEFRKIGTEGSPGTKVFSLVGKVKNTGLVEVPMGITLKELIFDIGGGIIGNKKFKAVQTGGPSGGCIPESLLDLHIDFDSLSKAGSMMGSGGMIVMDERTCMVDIAKYYLEFLSEESCGKCIPCREGIKRMLEILTDITEGRGRESDIDTLEEIAHTVLEASLCGLGKSAPNPVLTAIKYFKDEYLEHIINHRCPAGVCKELTTYFIEESDCKGCGLCKSKCPADAITGEIKQSFKIDNNKCIKCGNCIDTCKFSAVKVK